jgi:hypothetical protein
LGGAQRCPTDNKNCSEKSGRLPAASRAIPNRCGGGQQLFRRTGVSILEPCNRFINQRNPMRKIFVVLMTAGLAVVAARAQDTTNAPKTEIELFETQTGTVIVKGIGPVGSMNIGAGIVSVRSKETADIGTGRKLYGLVIEFTGGNQPRERAVIDYEELDSLLNGIDYLGKISYDVTALPGFEAGYATKSGVRIVAYSSRRQGGIQTFLQFGDHPRIPLASDQMAQLHGLISQEKNSLEALRTAK